ncbi:hypothetical protein [Mycobacterium botniense]|uniref:Uncharacterized protein n=1 Tax=Mycobacterium botniense TaxID=84962 RepID=A0A7I9XXY4_9MYCO|nr:hypothetical protein [Mycobacterium botniense]GFG74643.1 hypothetical protein MBOT_20080 [Mycobacterium botniense]
MIGVVTGQNLSGVLAQLSSWSNTLQSDINDAATDVQQAIDNVVQLFGGSGTNNPVSQILSQGKDAINQLVNSLQGLLTGNPFGDFANALQAIPGLNIAGQLRPATGVVLAGAHIVDINPELLWAPGFDTAASVSARAPQITWDGTTGRTNPGSLLIQPDGAYLYRCRQPDPGHARRAARHVDLGEVGRSRLHRNQPNPAGGAAVQVRRYAGAATRVIGRAGRVHQPASEPVGVAAAFANLHRPD